MQVVISSGGTGLTGRDGTPEAVAPLLDKTIDGFGELFRVLSPGGYCVLSTPNVDSYRSRHNTLWRGYHRYFRPESDTEKDSGHMHPIDLYFMMGAMKKAGFELLDLGVNSMEGRVGPSLWREFVRRYLSGLYPPRLRNKVPFYGDVLIYVMRKSGI